MYELIQVSDSCYYIQCPSKIGIVKSAQNEVCLIDSGNDKDAAKKAKKILDANGWTLQAVYNTHSHADHIGGNQYLQKQTGCKVYAHGIERDFTEHPILEPAFLYGANPPDQLRHKFLMAPESQAELLTEQCLPPGISMIALPGHCWDMVGFRSDDGVVFLADCLSSELTLQKYQINFLVDVQSYVDTLQAVKNMQAKLFIPSHIEPTEDIAPLAQLNIDKVYEIAELILNICARPTAFEQILKQVFDHYRLSLSFEQYALVGSTLRSYLSWLKQQDKLQVVLDSNMLLGASVSCEL